MVTMYHQFPVDLQEKIDVILDNHLYETLHAHSYRIAMAELRYVNHSFTRFYRPFYYTFA